MSCDCGCCEGVHALTPASLFNPPGRSALAYRVGTHGSFKETMTSAIAHSGALRALTTRTDDDPTIALIDAWSTVLDVLTFYQERIANEGFLRTAVEQRSVLELAREVGYEPAPGAAAAAALAFQLETAVGSPTELDLRRGVKVQSVPGPDELPQTFETVEEIDARPGWNAVHGRVTQPVTPALDATELYLVGVATNLTPGDMIIFVGDERAGDPTSERWDVRRLVTVETDRVGNLTRVTWEEPLGHRWSGSVIEPAQVHLKIYVLRGRAALFGHSAPDWRVIPNDLRPHFPAPNGDEWGSMTLAKVGAGAGTNGAGDVYLDTLYPHIVVGSWVVLVAPDAAHPQRGYRELYSVTAAVDDARTDFTIAAKTTRLTLSGENLREVYNGQIRRTVVYGQSEQLAVAESPLADPVQGNRIDLAEPTVRLPGGRSVLVTGRRARVLATTAGLVLQPFDGSAAVSLAPRDVLDVLAPFTTNLNGTRTWQLDDLRGHTGTVTAAANAFALVRAPATADVLQELATIATPTGDAPDDVTTLELTASLAHAYDRESLTVSANVARATAGETKHETLGSGAAAVPFQRFELKNAPLTYVPGSGPTGSTTTLEVRVNGILWHEVPALYGRGPKERVYTTRLDADGKIVVGFGDGLTGARLPSGTENVVATYRVGIGLVGEVAAGSLTLLTAPPLGVRSVTNPFAAAGAADPESLERARDNAPLTVLTFERAVSLRDFEDFAAAFAGVGKAAVTLLGGNEAEFIHLTLAADDGSPLGPESVTYGNLAAAIASSTEPHVVVRMDPYVELAFALGLRLIVDPDYEPDAVVAAVHAALLDAFSFERRRFAQPVAESQVETVAQLVAGVVAVDLVALHLAADTPHREPILVALPAHSVGPVVEPAELLTLAAAAIEVTV